MISRDCLAKKKAKVCKSMADLRALRPGFRLSTFEAHPRPVVPPSLIDDEHLEAADILWWLMLLGGLPVSPTSPRRLSVVLQLAAQLPECFALQGLERIWVPKAELSPAFTHPHPRKIQEALWRIHQPSKPLWISLGPERSLNFARRTSKAGPPQDVTRIRSDTQHLGGQVMERCFDNKLLRTS